MNLKSILLVSALSAAVAANAQAVPGGTLVVEQVGDGSAALTSAATPIFLNNFSTSGSLLNTYTVPATGGNALTNSGVATSEGTLTISGNSINFTGYRANTGTTGVASTTSAGTNRVVATFSTTTGAIDTSTSISDQFSGNNIRSSYTVGSTYYATGGNSGLVSGTLGTTTGDAALATTSVNNRYVQGFNNGIYFSTGSGTQGIYQYTPGTTGNQTLVLGTNALGGGTSPYDFQFLSATSLLVADSTVGISLYTNSGAGFVLSSTLAGSASSAFAFTGGSIYFTNAAGTTLNSATLNGTTFGTVTTLATASTNTLFRGIVYVPTQAVPEPSAFAALGLGALGLLKRRRSSK